MFLTNGLFSLMCISIALGLYNFVPWLKQVFFRSILQEKESRPSSPWTRKASTDSITAFGRNPDDSSSADSQSSSANSSNNSSLSSAEVMNEKLSTSSPLPSSSPRKTPSTGNVLSTRRPRSQTSFETVCIEVQVGEM